jgi:hypothetical protein
MAKIVRPNYDELIKYLRTVGIDASEVLEDSFDENGYESIQKADNGRPMYGGDLRFVREHHEWPSDEVYRKVQWLYEGNSLGSFPPRTKPEENDVKPAPPKDEPKPVVKDTTPPVTEKKQAAPAKAPRKKPNAG